MSTSIQEPPKTFADILKHIGPGLIISAAIVGSGELIMTTKTGAETGFKLLWFIILGCMIKVFVQLELGRHTLLTGKTTLDALNDIPGPKPIVSWIVWIWLLMFIATFFQLSGIVGTISGVFQLAGINLKELFLAALVTGSCALILLIGRYRFIERFSTAMVAVFTLFTVVAVFALNWTDYAISFANLAEGFMFKMPDDFTTAFAAFGIIGVGASELIYYPYWCLEKGYAKYLGPPEDSVEWRQRAEGWMKVLKTDAWISMVIYTLATIAFYLLGAAVLNGKGLDVTDSTIVSNLSQLYSESFGTAGLWVFLVGAFVVLYSTVFIATASNGRLCADLTRLLGFAKLETEDARSKAVRIACVALPAVYFLFYWTIPKPVTLVMIGGVAQAVMLPFLALTAIYHTNRIQHASLKPQGAENIFLRVSAFLMIATGVYSAYTKLFH